MIWVFIAGLMVGGSLATIVISLLHAASRADDDMDRHWKKLTGHSCGPKCSPLAGLHVSDW